MTPAELDGYLAEARSLTLAEIQALVPRDERYGPILYDLMLDYPMRSAKALRPALCIATCRALGGQLEPVLRSAATLELYHNAFLIHDDVEDGSESRRDAPTLHHTHGVPIAVNVGDAMLALALQPLLDNMRFIGMGKALRVLQLIARMARESAEGQAIELHWIHANLWDLRDTEYIRMVYKKTAWYTFMTPILLGGTIAGAAPARLMPLRKFAALLGIAFQIQDDILNLTAEGSAYGKETAGDLWEGKHTLVLMHALRCATPSERERAVSILAKPRPAVHATQADGPVELQQLLDSMAASGEISSSAHQTLANHAAALAGNPRPQKTVSDIELLTHLIRKYDSIEHARAISRRYAQRADDLLQRCDWLAPSIHREFLDGLVGFVVTRDR